MKTYGFATYLMHLLFKFMISNQNLMAIQLHGSATQVAKQPSSEHKRQVSAAGQRVSEKKQEHAWNLKNDDFAKGIPPKSFENH